MVHVSPLALFYDMQQPHHFCRKTLKAAASGLLAVRIHDIKSPRFVDIQ